VNICRLLGHSPSLSIVTSGGSEGWRTTWTTTCKRCPIPLAKYYGRQWSAGSFPTVPNDPVQAATVRPQARLPQQGWIEVEDEEHRPVLIFPISAAAS
jgi:hypothetical protein